jgi:hypothetical protein
MLGLENTTRTKALLSNTHPPKQEREPVDGKGHAVASPSNGPAGSFIVQRILGLMYATRAKALLSNTPEGGKGEAVEGTIL